MPLDTLLLGIIATLEGVMLTMLALQAFQIKRTMLEWKGIAQDPEMRKGIFLELGRGISHGLMERVGGVKGAMVKEGMAQLGEIAPEAASLATLAGMVPKKWQPALPYILNFLNQRGMLSGGSVSQMPQGNAGWHD